MSGLLITASDAGTANFLVPVMPRLEGGFDLAAQEPAASIFSRAGIAHRRLPRTDWDGLAGLGDEALSGRACRAVLCGSSWGPTLDKAVTAAARSQGVPSTAIVDHWEHYMERFSRIDAGRIVSRGEFLADAVWLPDEQAVSEAVRAGLPRGRLRAAGQPHLEARAAALRAAGGLGAGGPVVFVSETIAGDSAPGTPGDPGFTEHDALAMLISALDSPRRGLVVKLHPKEDRRKYDYLAAEGVAAEVAGDGDAVDILLGAHRVTGISSMLLLEAGLVRRDALSIVPKGDPGRFAGNRLGLTTPVQSAGELRSCLGGPPARREDPSLGDRFSGSRERVAGLLARL